MEGVSNIFGGVPRPRMFFRAPWFGVSIRVEGFFPGVEQVEHLKAVKTHPEAPTMVELYTQNK